jgi:hypothetical protein
LQESFAHFVTLPHGATGVLYDIPELGLGVVRKETLLFRLPSILVLHLRSFEFNPDGAGLGKIAPTREFPFALDLRPWMYHDYPDQGHRLSGVIAHVSPGLPLAIIRHASVQAVMMLGFSPRTA